MLFLPSFVSLVPSKVGDIHGQLADLVHLMNHNGLPSETNKYIFNGDFVDRGVQGVEVRALARGTVSAAVYRRMCGR